jgi:hypothetical protein
MYESELSPERMFVSFGLAHCGVDVEAQRRALDRGHSYLICDQRPNVHHPDATATPFMFACMINHAGEWQLTWLVLSWKCFNSGEVCSRAGLESQNAFTRIKHGAMSDQQDNEGS